jgi:hypothetical protein
MLATERLSMRIPELKCAWWRWAIGLEGALCTPRFRQCHWYWR